MLKLIYKVLVEIKDVLRSEFRALHARMDRLEKNADRLEERADRIETKVDRLTVLVEDIHSDHEEPGPATTLRLVAGPVQEQP